MMDKKKQAKTKKVDLKLDKWRSKYTNAKSKYDKQLKLMDEHEMLYDGSPKVLAERNQASQKTADSRNVYNLVYEMLESEVDCTIPQPKVTPLHKEDEELARKIECYLKAELDRLPFEQINDADERSCYIIGTSFMEVTWDYLGGLHETLGANDVHALNSRQIIPQPGKYRLVDMDYFFAVQADTKEGVERKYGKAVDAEYEDNTDVRQRGDEVQNADDMVTVVSAYFKNKGGGVGRYTWCGDTTLEDFDDYLQKQRRVCTKCGRPMDGQTCVCGSEKWKLVPMETETLFEPVQASFGVLEPTMYQPVNPTNPDGSMQYQVDEYGEQIMDADGMPIPVEAYTEVAVEVPVYKIRDYTIIQRNNISRTNCFLGVSDVEVIRDQQEAIKKIGSKMQEKVLKGGSVVLMPEGAKMETSDREMKIARVKNAAEKGLWDVLTIQADISKDITLLEKNRELAQSALGITDSYQGKYDASASSGTAKQTQVNQAAGRLESKRVMKQYAWSEMFRMMFQQWLAFSNDAVCVSRETIDGMEYSEMSKWDFLKRDDAGQFYWNDEFLFSVDTASLTPADRNGLQEEAKQNFASGAFGDPTTVEARIAYWRYMRLLHYPMAQEMLDIQLEQQQQMIAQQQMMQQQGVIV